MQPTKLTIHIVEHKPTGAQIPVIVRKVDENNIIQDYVEHIDGRKGFTVDMLKIRWNKDKHEIAEILQEYQVPGHLSHERVAKIKDFELPIDAAIFWEEYIYGIEKKEKMSHKKVKAKTFETAH